MKRSRAINLVRENEIQIEKDCKGIVKFLKEAFPEDPFFEKYPKHSEEYQDAMNKKYFSKGDYERWWPYNNAISNIEIVKLSSIVKKSKYEKLEKRVEELENGIKSSAESVFKALETEREQSFSKEYAHMPPVVYSDFFKPLDFTPESPEPVKLEVGKWYKHPSGAIFNLTSEDSRGHLQGYGINEFGQWMDHTSEKNNGCACNSVEKIYLKPATDKEVQDDLEKEAKKQGLVTGAHITRMGLSMNNSICLRYSNRGYSLLDNALYLHGYLIFENGIWAKPLNTITKKQAEKELGKKIVG